MSGPLPVVYYFLPWSKPPLSFLGLYSSEFLLLLLSFVSLIKTLIGTDDALHQMMPNYVSFT